MFCAPLAHPNRYGVGLVSDTCSSVNATAPSALLGTFQFPNASAAAAAFSPSADIVVFVGGRIANTYAASICPDLISRSSLTSDIYIARSGAFFGITTYYGTAIASAAPAALPNFDIGFAVGGMYALPSTLLPEY